MEYEEIEHIEELAKKEVLKKVINLVDSKTSRGEYVHLSDLVKIFPEMFEEKTQTVKSRVFNDYQDEYEDREYTYHCYRVKGTKKWYGGVPEEEE